MKGELKAGGLALVIGDNPHTGKCVELVKFLTPGQSFIIPGCGGESFLSLRADACWLVTGSVYPKGCERDHGWSLFAPCYLLPIDGDDHHLSGATGDELNRIAKQVGYKPAELTA